MPYAQDTEKEERKFLSFWFNCETAAVLASSNPSTAPKKIHVMPTGAKKIEIPLEEPRASGLEEGTAPHLQPPWVPVRAQDLRTVSNWVIKIVRLAATGDPDAQQWAQQQGVSEDLPLPASIDLPQCVHQTDGQCTHQSSFDYRRRWVKFNWHAFFESIRHWVVAAPEVQGTRASGPDPPIACFCTHDGVPDPRVRGSNKYFLVLFWDRSGCLGVGDQEDYLLGVVTSHSGARPSFKAPFDGPVQQTWRTGTVARTAVHCTSGPQTRVGRYSRPVPPELRQAPLMASPTPQTEAPGPLVSVEAAQRAVQQGLPADCSWKSLVQALQLEEPRASGPQPWTTRVPKLVQADTETWKVRLGDERNLEAPRALQTGHRASVPETSTTDENNGTTAETQASPLQATWSESEWEHQRHGWGTHIGSIYTTHMFHLE